MPDEQDRIMTLQREKQGLEHALAQTQLKLLVSESLLECVEEHYQVDVKKTFGAAVQKKSSPKSRNRS